VSGLAGHVEDYLRLRRALGFKLRFHGQVLPSLAAYLEAAGATTVTAELAVAWAALPQGVHPVVWSHRLGAARGFARYLKTADPAAEIPPDRVWTTVAPRRQPVIFTDGDIARLLQAARALNPPLRAATFEAMLGLIAATGMRLGEAIGLDRAGTDLGAGLLTIVSTKSGRDRLLPLHPTVTAALAGYARRRDELCPAPSTSRFFVSSASTPVHERLADLAFAQLTSRLGLRAEGRQPRIHDLRHTFAVRQLLAWHRDGADVNAKMPVLSAYLGHVSPAGTYWYLTAVPELMELVAARLTRAGQP
jgi:integrase/recombinase XerD